MITAEHSLLQDEALGLQFNGLEEVSELKLDTGQLGNARSDFLVHGTCNLEEGIYALAIKLESSLKLTIFIGLLCTR